MIFDAVMDEVRQLQVVGTRLQELADQHPSISKGLLLVSQSVHNAANVLAVMVATEGDGHKPRGVQ